MFSKAYKRYVLLILSSIYFLSFMDRWVVGLFMQPIKDEFQLNDTDLGFLTGTAFAIFYAVIGIPIARWADRGNRVAIIALAIAFWSGMVMLCGLVVNFVQLTLARLGAAIGEAGVMPPAYSLIADYFSPQERSRAVSIYIMAIPTSVLVGLTFAGWVAEDYGWRVAFMLVAAPGFLMAIVAKLTLREPRVQHEKKTAPPEDMLPLLMVIRTLWRQLTFRHLLVGITLMNFVSTGVATWYGTFFIRNHGMTLGDLGLWSGVATGLGGLVGIWLGAHLASRYFVNDAAAQLRFAAWTRIVLFLTILSTLLSPSWEVAFALLFVVNVLIWIPAGPMTAILLQLVEDRMRATAMAFLSLTLNLIGMGLGPQVVGLMSDGLEPYLGEDALRAAMILGASVSFGVAYYYWLAARTVTDNPMSQPSYSDLSDPLQPKTKSFNVPDEAG